MSVRTWSALAVLCLSAGCAIASGQASAPTVAIVNAKIFTGVAASPWAEALTVVGDRIGVVGTSAVVRPLAGASTRVIDAKGAVVIPGINDAHVHLGTNPPGVELEGPPAAQHDPTLDEVLGRLRTAVAKAGPGAWIRGEIGAHVLDDPKATRSTLDAVAPNHPVVLMAWTGHGTLLNSLALRRLEVIDFPLAGMTAWKEPAAVALPGAPRVIVSGTKFILDGTPIERLMLLREPYSDRPADRGRANFTVGDLAGFLQRARNRGEQPMVHAVGDGAIDQVLTALDATGGGAWQPLRPRIEHGDLLDAPMLAAGVPVAIGSDGPLNPYLNVMFASIDANNPAEAMTREQAIAAYTAGSVRAEMMETRKGTLAPGMLADLAILSQDIFAVPPDALPGTVSVLTLVGGAIVHERK